MQTLKVIRALDCVVDQMTRLRNDVLSKYDDEITGETYSALQKFDDAISAYDETNQTVDLIKVKIAAEQVLAEANKLLGA